MLFQLFAASSLAVASVAAGSQVQFTDSFMVTADTWDLNLQLDARQSGTLATQTYAKAGCDDWQIQMNDEVAAVRIYPTAGNTAPRVSLNHDFSETGEFHLHMTVEPYTSSYCFVNLGGIQGVHLPSAGISLRFYSNGDLKLFSGGSEVTAAAASLSGTSVFAVDVYISTPPGFDGGGTARVHARVNGEIWDMNGTAAGYAHETDGFADNFITFGAYASSYQQAWIRELSLYDRTPLHGVGWWHGYTGTNDAVGLQGIEELSPAYFQERIPYYGEITGKDSSVFGSDTQAEMDQQLDYAIAAGIDYIVWDTYPPRYVGENNLNDYGLQMYLASSRRSQVSFCVDMMGSGFSYWEYGMKDWFLNLMTNSAYFKVLDGRPLIYVFNLPSYISAGSYSNVAYMLEDLSAASIAQGTGDPYIVGTCWTYNEITNAVAHFGETIDSYSRYAGGVTGYSSWNAYRDEASHRYLPQASTGWDPFPRQENCAAWNDGYPRGPWKTEAAPDRIVEMLQDARNWVNDFPLSAEVPLVHSFGWNDCSEGARIVPSLFKGVDRINAFATATGADGVNAAFELGAATLNDSWTTISFTNVYDYPPVVILGPPSYSGTSPVSTRIRNVTRTNFQAKVQEWECDDGSHMNETVHWLAIPPGTYTIDGQKVVAAKAWVTDDLRLFEDEFYATDNPNTQDVNYNIDVDSDKLRQKGFSAYEQVIDYVCGPNGSDWQQQMPNGSSYFRLYANNNLASVSPDVSFSDTGRFRIETETKVGSAEYNVISFGAQNSNDANPSGGFALRIYSNGDIRCWAEGQELTAAATNLTAAQYQVALQVDTPSAFDGSGTATIRLTVNGMPIDLNGTAAGLVHTQDGLSSNYITLGTYSSGSVKDGCFYSLKLYDENQFTFVPTEAFSSSPVVLAQVETDYNTNAVAPRVCSVSTNGFLVHLQSQETNTLFASDAYQVHSGEITGFVLMEPGQSDSSAFEVGTATGIYSGDKWISYSAAPLTNPRIFASLNTFNNEDPTVLRHENLGSYGVHLRGQEETSYDAEQTILPTETAGWVVFQD
ncbi:H-type lectin domain-containing protein [Tichowtungia aerotolerans]|uniref:H-type lectin domain-containing protein n=1 Tax=Tichowtungia aerotolerans TaxID=2697043 RepID=A0A6P1MC73_9BACT|nr:H-type lectin domain-containing protein [Tichowtungia aerotolerans]QHI68685.1 hypothetical protein GT409_04230 [Tichowtungia aerotolerans]